MKKVGESFKSSTSIPTVKYDGESVLVWGYFSLADADSLHFINGIMTGEGYVNILQINLISSAEKINIQDPFIWQWDNLKHISKVAKRFLNENNIDVLLSQHKVQISTELNT